MTRMKAIDHFGQNRPVHLARRDIYFERAVELIRNLQHVYSPESQVNDYEEILFLLRIAREHAHFAIREAGKNEKDEQFSWFIDLLTGNIKAVLSMLHLKTSVESEDSSVVSFLGTNRASVALQAEEYQLRANDIVRSILNTLQLAEEPFCHLKEEYTVNSSEDDLARYSKAREHFEELAKEGKSWRRIAARFRSREEF